MAGCESGREIERRKAEFWLKLARRDSSHRNVDVDVIWLRHWVEMAGIRLETIGTSEEELETLLRKGYKAEAKNRLKLARIRCSVEGVDSDVKLVQEYVEKAGIDLKTIGTSKKELKQLLRKGYRAEAEKWLKVARECRSKQKVDSAVKWVREYVEKAGITLEEIGTSDEELKKLLEESEESF